MSKRVLGVALMALGPLLVAAPPASAQPSCVAQSIVVEHAEFGTAWGHDLVAFLATHPQFLQQFGFANYGDLARFSAAQDRTSCPPDL
jgi:hypothetical protein